MKGVPAGSCSVPGCKCGFVLPPAPPTVWVTADDGPAFEAALDSDRYNVLALRDALTGKEYELVRDAEGQWALR